MGVRGWRLLLLVVVGESANLFARGFFFLLFRRRGVGGEEGREVSFHVHALEPVVVFFLTLHHLLLWS